MFGLLAPSGGIDICLPPPVRKEAIGGGERLLVPLELGRTIRLDCPLP